MYDYVSLFLPSHAVSADREHIQGCGKIFLLSSEKHSQNLTLPTLKLHFWGGKVSAIHSHNIARMFLHDCVHVSEPPRFRCSLDCDRKTSRPTDTASSSSSSSSHCHMRAQFLEGVGSAMLNFISVKIVTRHHREGRKEVHFG